MHSKLFSCVTLLGGEAATSDETEDVAFFSIDELPQLSQNRTNEKHINELKKHLKDDKRPRIF